MADFRYFIAAGGFSDSEYEVVEEGTVGLPISLAMPEASTVIVTVMCVNGEGQCLRGCGLRMSMAFLCTDLSPNGFTVTFDPGETGPIVTNVSALPDADSDNERAICSLDLTLDQVDGFSQFAVITIVDADNGECSLIMGGHTH